MASIYHMRQSGVGIVVDVGIPDAIEGVARDGNPASYDMDEIAVDPLLSGYTSRTWRRIIRHPDERVKDEPWDGAGAGRGSCPS